MVRYSRVPPGRRARLRSTSRHGPLLGSLGQPAAPLTAPVIRNGFWHRLRGRGPFTVIPLGQLPEEQRSLLLQALCEEIGSQLAMSVTSSVNRSQMDTPENSEHSSVSAPPSTLTSSPSNTPRDRPSSLLITPRGGGSAGKAQLEAKSVSIYEHMMTDWKFLATLVMIVLVACAIGYIFRKDLNSIHAMRIPNQIKENKNDLENLYYRQVV